MTPRPFAHRFRKPLAALALGLAIAFALGLGALTPNAALAKGYECPRVSIQAQAQTDGGLRVTEQRAFAFDGSFSAVWWELGNGLPDNAQVAIHSLRMATIDEEGRVTSSWRSLPSAAFQLAWRDSGGPAQPAWSYDSAQETVYAFFGPTDQRTLFELDYEVINGVQAYDDVAEIYWKYVGDSWAADSSDVTLDIALPLPAGIEAAPGGNVRAWGHGPLDGTVSIQEDGTVSYRVPLVRAGQYAEARVTFPVSWLTQLSPEAREEHEGITRLDAVLAEEEAWADQANTQRMMSLLYVVAIIAACAAALVAALLIWRKHGREHAPSFTGEYWRDVPEPGLQPALIGRLWRWDHESNEDLVATIMHLAHVGALRIDKGSYPGAKGKPVDDYYLTRMEPAASACTDPIERATLDLLFEQMAKGADALWLGSIREYGREEPQAYVEAMDGWQAMLSAQSNQQDFFEAKSHRLATVVAAMAAAYLIGGIALAVLTGDLIPVVFMVPTGIALAVIANYMPRRTVRGNEIAARCKALRNWLRDFSSLDERPPTDVRVWGEFMVYAYLFGVADRAMRELRATVPEVLEAPAGSAMADAYVPWYVWYLAGPGLGGRSMPSITDALSDTVGRTFSTAQSAIAAAKGGPSGFSGGFGGGGGFSVGGGGGFGGGGGAR